MVYDVNVVAYWDPHDGVITPAEEIREICTETGTSPVQDWELMPLYRGGVQSGKVIARECRTCGAPLGRIDPDEARYVALGTCSDCRE